MTAPSDVAPMPSDEPVSVKNKVLETGAAVTQNFDPIKSICAHLNAFHVYASDPSRCVEANHYCTHISEDFRQCLIYDSPDSNARLIGIEYMITPRLYKSLPEEEKRLWHSHVFEVKSGMLIMPTPAVLPTGIWEQAETKEMEEVIGLYGKTYHLWQVDRGDQVPMGAPELMMSFTEEAQFGKNKEKWEERNQRFAVDSEAKKHKRAHIAEPEIDRDADSMWHKGDNAER